MHVRLVNFEALCNPSLLACFSWIYPILEHIINCVGFVDVALIFTPLPSLGFSITSEPTLLHNNNNNRFCSHLLTCIACVQLYRFVSFYASGHLQARISYRLMKTPKLWLFNSLPMSPVLTYSLVILAFRLLGPEPYLKPLKCVWL